MNKQKKVLQQQMMEKEFKKQEESDGLLEEHRNLLIRTQQRDRIVRETIRQKIDQLRYSLRL